MVGRRQSGQVGPSRDTRGQCADATQDSSLLFRGAPCREIGLPQSGGVPSVEMPKKRLDSHSVGMPRGGLVLQEYMGRGPHRLSNPPTLGQGRGLPVKMPPPRRLQLLGPTPGSPGTAGLQLNFLPSPVSSLVVIKPFQSSASSFKGVSE